MANSEPVLLTDNPMVDKFYDNTQSNVIRITDDKLKVILLENKESLVRNNDFLAPMTLLISLILTFCTTDFKEFFFPGTVWKAFYLFLTLAAIIWLIIEIRKRKNNISIEELINKIRNQRIPSVIVGTGGIIVYSANYMWTNGQVDVTGKIKDLVTQGTLKGIVGPNILGISDPVPGISKSLNIHYRINGAEKTLTKKDGEAFEIN